MEVIQIKFYGNVIECSKKKQYTGMCNTCKVTENNEFMFTSDYLEKHFDTLEFYISPMIMENHVEKIVIESKSFLPYIKRFLNHFKQINKLVICEDKVLEVSDFKEIVELKYIHEIDCYDMDVKLYKTLASKYHKHVRLHSEILFESDMMFYNHIATYSDVYYKKIFRITSNMDTIDKEEFTYFIDNNVALEKIEVKSFTKNNIDYLASTLKNSKVSIVLLTEETLTANDLKYLKKIKKKKNVNLELEYSKAYKRDNAFKQLNLNILRFSMCLLIIIGFSFISVQHIIFARDKENTDDVIDITKYDAIVEETKEELKAPVEEVTPEVTEEPTVQYVSPYYQKYTEQFTELKKINQDTVGWIQVNNTKVNYPVVQASDNEYYLNHSFDKSANTFGWIYADYRSHFDVLNQNTILYGHNVLGTDLLFSSLEKTVDPAWYNNEANLTITFNTEKGNMKWKVFSIYVVPVTNDYLITNFNSESSFLSFVQKLKSRSVKDFGVEVSGTDRILTLSTCYKDSSKRVVVHAKRIS